MTNEDELKFKIVYLEKISTNIKDTIRKFKEQLAEEQIRACTEHKLICTAHGHNDDYYECTKCPYYEWR